MQFRPQLQEMRFLLEKVAGFDALVAEGLAPDVDDGMLTLMLDQAGRFAADVLAPLNPIGDREGAAFHDGRVALPDGFAAAYADWAGAGWAAAGGPQAFGGMELPVSISSLLLELWTTANMAFAMAPTLNAGAVETLAEHADDTLKAGYLSQLVSGEWTATMALTEPQSGSDLSDLRTMARPASDGSYRITGRKIFITFGEHDLSPNIVHLVLARLPDAPPGSRGISLFLAPKVLPGGGLNDIICTGIEHKMGIHASPTCSMSFGEGGEGAVGWLVGAPNQGLACMFTMMNRARVATALQGVGIAERATQAAYAFARERTQGRAPGASQPSPIADHPDVKRMLLDMRGCALGSRALAYAAAVAIDRAQRDPDPARAAAAAARAALLTPMAKAWCTEAGFDTASTGVQVHGGMGYVEETGVAQHLRDARIALIYGGSNGIQAIDLVGRKIVRDGGAAAASLLAELTDIADEAAASPALAESAAQLWQALESVQEMVSWLVGPGRAEAERLSVATAFLGAFATAVCAALLIKGACQAAGGGRPRDLTFVAQRFAGERLRRAIAGAEGARSAGALAGHPDALCAYA